MVEHEPTGPVDTLTWSFSRVAMWAPAAIVVIIFYEVVMRYVFLAPTYWVNEMSLWIGGMIYVTAGLYSMQQRSHIRIFVLYDLAPLWLRRVFDALSALCVTIFALAVIWGGFGEALSRFWRWELFGTVFDPPIPAVNKPLVLITLLVLALQAVSNLVRDWPANPVVRKVFDIFSVLCLLAVMAAASPHLFDFSESGPKTPVSWRLAFGLLMAAAAVILLRSLIRDFNKTPPPIVESHDPADEMDLPDEVLSGLPPRTDASAGKMSRRED